MLPRWWLTAAFGVLLGSLMLASHSRMTGDASEYLTMAERFAHFEGPSLSSEDVRLDRFGERPILNHAGRFELWHFWVFPLLAAPFVTLASAMRLPPLAGFALLNALLLLYACWSVTRRFGGWAAALLFFSPIVWWSDKAQVEVFTVTLLALAASNLDRLSIAALFCGLASTQNPPIAIFAATAACAGWCVPRCRPLRGPLWGWLIAAALVLLHPLYYLAHIGRLTPLVGGRAILIPTARFLVAPLLDLNLGLVWSAPLFALAAGAAWFVALRRARAAAILAAAGALALLVAFAQAPNVNSGGTPGMDRYALWLFPFALPLVRAAVHSRAVRLGILLSAASSPIVFRPSIPESFLQPTALAMYVWTRHPGWDNPSAEIFAERLRHQDGVNTRAATPRCEKVLVEDGEWPATCAAALVPAACRAAICYANGRPDATYAYVTTARRPGWWLAFP